MEGRKKERRKKKKEDINTRYFKYVELSIIN
jgi:hypothetical protein